MKLQGQKCLQSGLSNLNLYIALYFFLPGQRDMENVWKLKNNLKTEIYTRHRMLQSVCLIRISKWNCYMYVLKMAVQFIY